MLTNTYYIKINTGFGPPDYYRTVARMENVTTESSLTEVSNAIITTMSLLVEHIQGEILGYDGYYYLIPPQEYDAGIATGLWKEEDFRDLKWDKSL